MEQQFDSLSTYLNLAKKTISKFSNKYYSTLRIEMLNNEEAISDVAYAIMQADWKWDKDRVGKTGLSKSKYAYRNQCAIWAIQTYVSKKYKTKKNFSLDHSVDGQDSETSAHNIIAGKCEDPSAILIEKEEKEIVNTLIKSLLNSNLISTKQKEQIQMYYFENMTLNTIGQKFGVTREAVRLNIKKAIQTFQKLSEQVA